jgi:hypothetical protein
MSNLPLVAIGGFKSSERQEQDVLLCEVARLKIAVLTPIPVFAPSIPFVIRKRIA